MIFVVELPPHGEPRAWFAFDDEDFARKIAASYLLDSWEVLLQVDPVFRRDALAAALDARGGQSCIYWSDRDAIGAFEGADPRLAGKDRWSARRALYEQLVALEVLADDN